MRIQTTIVDEGTIPTHTIGGETYHFTERNDGSKCADIENPEHIRRFLAIDGFQMHETTSQEDIETVFGEIENGDWLELADPAQLAVAHIVAFNFEPVPGTPREDIIGAVKAEMAERFDGVLPAKDAALDDDAAVTETTSIHAPNPMASNSQVDQEPEVSDAEEETEVSEEENAEPVERSSLTDMSDEDLADLFELETGKKARANASRDTMIEKIEEARAE